MNCSLYLLFYDVINGFSMSGWRKGFSTVDNPTVQKPPPEGRGETENVCQHAEKAAACPENEDTRTGNRINFYTEYKTQPRVTHNLLF